MTDPREDIGRWVGMTRKGHALLFALVLTLVGLLGWTAFKVVDLSGATGTAIERVEVVERVVGEPRCARPRSERCQRHLELSIRAMTPRQGHRVFLKHREFLRRQAQK